MFIYKITILTTNKCYIGFDTHPSYKLKRWKEHLLNFKKNKKTKLYKAMADAGIENCKIEILHDNFTSISELALAEISYIKQYDTFNNGLNSTTGGDGLGYKTLNRLTNEEIEIIKQSLGDSFSNYNKNIKWANTTPDQRKNLTKHLHTSEIIAKRKETLSAYYEANPEIKKTKSIGIKKWQKMNEDKMKETNRINGLKGAAKLSKSIKVEFPDGNIVTYVSKSEMQRQTGQWAKTLIDKTKQGMSYNGYKAWEI